MTKARRTKKTEYVIQTRPIDGLVWEDDSYMPDRKSAKALINDLIRLPGAHRFDIALVKRTTTDELIKI